MLIPNKKAQFNYILGEKIEAGISLIGGEVKAIKSGSADLSQSYVRIINNEAFLVNANIPIEGKKEYNSTRSRKLLLKRSQIISVQSKIGSKGLTFVPTKMYNRGRLVKVELAIAKPKRQFEKREAIKKKDLEREIAKEFKNSV